MYLLIIIILKNDFTNKLSKFYIESSIYYAQQKGYELYNLKLID